MEFEEKAERFYNKPIVTLDLTDMCEQQHREAAVLMGGSSARYVTPEDNFEFSEITNVVWNWGDEAIEDVFAQLHEHIQEPGVETSEGTFSPFFRFSPSAVIDNEIWTMALQDKDFDPREAYPDESMYRIIPHTLEAAREALVEIHTPSSVKKEFFGYVAGRYLAFEVGTDIGPPEPLELQSNEPQPDYLDKLDTKETITGRELFNLAHEIIESLTFEDPDDQHKAFALLHLLMETTGQGNDESGYSVFPNRDNYIQGKEIPALLQPVITEVIFGDLVTYNENTLKVKTSIDQIEEDIVIPKWKQLFERELSFDQVYEIIKNSPEILAGIHAPKVMVVPAIEVEYEPEMSGWGLYYTLDSFGVRFSVYGRPNETWEATNFITENDPNSPEMKKMAAELTLLGIERSTEGTWQQKREFGSSIIEKLAARLNGDTYPPIKRFSRKPGNALKSLMIERLISEGVWLPEEN